MTTPYVPAQYEEYVFLSPKQLQVILNISRSKCYSFLHNVSESPHPMFKVERPRKSLCNRHDMTV